VSAADRVVTVIGANGFLGAPLVDALLDRGAEVRAFDRYSTPPRHRIDRDVTVFQGDLLSRTSLAAAVDGSHDVLHFMSLTNPETSVRDPLHDVTTNLTAGVELFSLCAAKGVERVLFASSGGTVYGQSSSPSREDSPRNPVSPYGIGKAALEDYLHYFAVEHGLRSVALRISNPYGPGQKPRSTQGIIPIALRAARDGTQLRRLGDGSMIRDYVFQPDVVEMILRTWAADGARQDAYNIGSGTGTSLSTVLKTVEHVTGRELDMFEVPPPSSFVHTSVLDTGRFVAEFGEVPLTTLAEGVERTWEHIRAEPA
jgi:UDP-glucose 4-epimerase